MKLFKKIIIYILPLIILWGSFYFVKDIDISDVWWGFPYYATCILAICLSLLNITINIEEK